MENHHNGLNLILKLRSICCRAAAEGKTTVRPATLHLINKQIRQMRKSVRQADLFSA
jgi:hypothetical protein